MDGKFVLLEAAGDEETGRDSGEYTTNSNQKHLKMYMVQLPNYFLCNEKYNV